MAEIVLATLNAKYIHASFGLRYLFANLKDLQEKARILEFEIHTRPIDVVEAILKENPSIVGLGVYIWNVKQTEEVISLLKRVRPALTVIIGGPEVSFEIEEQPICKLADYVICGEADLEFANVCRKLIVGEQPASKIIPSPLPQPLQLQLPYSLYSDSDIKNRVIYVEASRGCPFTCEFCLSSLDIPVRQFELEPFLAEMKSLLDRGVRQFKFVDRTFNLNLKISRAILEFFLDNYTDGLFVHFEMIPDRLPEALREVIGRFPAGSLQFEVGIQTFNPEVGKLISRRQDNSKLDDNLRFLRTRSGVHIHTDLIIGLPGEDVESFAMGFDRLVSIDPQEIQVGVLKRLRGTPIVRHDAEWQMVYDQNPPYEILQNKLIDFQTMQRLKRFSRFWDLISNSGNFELTKRLIWKNGKPFDEFLEFSDWLYAKAGRRHGIALAALSRFLFEYLVTVKEIPADAVTTSIEADYQRLNRTERPLGSSNQPLTKSIVTEKASIPARQARHLEVVTGNPLGARSSRPHLR